MTICDDCFEDFIHPLVHESMEKNDKFWNEVGPHDHWNWDYKNSILTFSDCERPTVRIHVSIAGTTEGNLWEWSRANANLDSHTKLGMGKVREFGINNGYEKLSTAFLNADEHTGWEMTSVVVHVLGAFDSYRFPTDHGDCYVVFRERPLVN